MFLLFTKCSSSFLYFLTLSFCFNSLLNRESVAAEKVKEAHKRVMIANHPDAGGSDYLATKINEAKDVMLGKSKGGGGSAF